MAQVRPGQPPAAAEYWLQDENGIYPLKAGENTLGRLPENDLVLQGPCVSRQHCTIVVVAGADCELRDSGSTNGTYVNGLKVSGATKLLSGDVIWICDRRLMFLPKGGSGQLA
jgi:pSer/pThr/pTyr-binding forkhead associated (FHA) protein